MPTVARCLLLRWRVLLHHDVASHGAVGVFRNQNVVASSIGQKHCAVRSPGWQHAPVLTIFVDGRNSRRQCIVPLVADSVNETVSAVLLSERRLIE